MREPIMSFLLGLAIAAQGFCADIYISRKLKSGEKAIHSIVLLPSTAYKKREGESARRAKAAIKEGLKGPFGNRDNIPSEAAEEKADALGIEIDSIVSNALRQRGWQVNDGGFSNQAMQNNEKKQYLVDNLLAQYEILVRQMMKRPKDTAKGRYSLGDMANLSFAESIDVVALVYGTRHWIVKNNFISVVKYKYPEFGKDGQPVNTFLHLSLLDPRTGEVLCYLQIPGAVEERILEGLKEVPQR